MILKIKMNICPEPHILDFLFNIFRDILQGKNVINNLFNILNK